MMDIGYFWRNGSGYDVAACVALPSFPDTAENGATHEREREVWKRHRYQEDARYGQERERHPNRRRGTAAFVGGADFVGSLLHGLRGLWVVRHPARKPLAEWDRSDRRTCPST